MSRSHYIAPTIPVPAGTTVRFGAGTGSSNNWSPDLENGKFVKLVAESRYDLAAAGDAIQGVVDAVEVASQNGYTIGTVADSAKFLNVTFDGLQATAGTGTVALGDYVVVGTVVAKGTALTSHPKVCKATSQAVSFFNWRVVSLGTAGTGAVGTVGVIQRV